MVYRHIGTSAPGLFKETRISFGQGVPVKRKETIEYRGILYVTDKRVILQCKALLFDYLPMKRKEANALYMAFDVGIPDHMRQVSIIRPTDIIRYERQLQYHYGLDANLTQQVIEVWARALGVNADYDFLSNKEKAEKSDEEIYRKYCNADSVYEMLTMALKAKFPFVKDNYSGTSKYYDDIIIDLYQYNKDNAIEGSALRLRYKGMNNVYWIYGIAFFS